MADEVLLMQVISVIIPIHIINLDGSRSLLNGIQTEVTGPLDYPSIHQGFKTNDDG